MTETDSNNPSSPGLADLKRKQALGLTPPLTPYNESDNPPPAPPSSPSPDQRQGAAKDLATVTLPALKKAELRPYPVAGKVTEEVNKGLNELTKLSERSRSYIVSEALAATLPAWIAQKKAEIEAEKTKKKQNS